MVGYGRPGSSAIKQGIFTSKPVSVQVVDESGAPVDNATLAAWTVPQDNLNATIDDKRAEADRLLDEAQNPEPPEWDAGADISPDGELETGTDEKYVTVHTESDMGLSGYSDSPDLSPGRVAVSEGTTLHFYVWDPTDRAFDGISRQHKGTPTDGTVVVEKLDHKGDVVDSREVDLTKTYAGTWPTFKHDFGTTDLPPGFYRISAKGSSLSYVITVGNPADAIAENLKNRADIKTDQANWLADRLTEGKLDRQRVATDTNGNATVNIAQSAEIIALQAYKTDAPNANPGSMSLQEVNDLHESENYQGAMYYSPTPKRVDLATFDNQNDTATVDVIRANHAPYESLNRSEMMAQAIADYLENRTVDFAGADYAGDDVLDVRDSLQAIIESDDDLHSSYCETYPEYCTSGAIDFDSDANAADHVRTMRYVLESDATVQNADTGDGEIADGTLNLRVDAGDIADDAEVLVHWQDGTYQSIAAEYYHVESGVGSDTLVIDGYPVPDDRAHATIEVVGTTDDGEVKRARERVENPAYAGDIIEFEGITVSTLSPGVSETVTVDPTLGGETDATLVNATVRYPNGTETSATVADGAATFDTDGEGAHTLRLEFDENGNTWVKALRIDAENPGINAPPTVYEQHGDAQYALGEGLAGVDAETEAAGTRTRLTAIIGADETVPQSVVYHPKASSTDDLRLQVRRGPSRSQIRAHVSTEIHTQLSDDALVYRNGDEPITADGSTKFGDFERGENGSTVINTYTGETGEVQITVKQDPNALDRAIHRVRLVTSEWSFNPLSLLGSFVPDLPAVSSVSIGPTTDAATRGVAA